MTTPLSVPSLLSPLNDASVNIADFQSSFEFPSKAEFTSPTESEPESPPFA